jgi:protein-arginine kinase activator protein McsA
MVKTKTHVPTQIITLDSKHNEVMDTFRENELFNIPRLKQLRNKYCKQLKISNEIDIKLLCNDKIKEYTQQIKQMESDKQSYFLDNSSLIFEYFEGKKNIELNATNIKTKNGGNIDSKDTIVNAPLSKNSLLQNFFAAKPKANLELVGNTNNNNSFQSEPNSSLSELNTQPRNLTTEYLSKFNDSFIDIDQYLYVRTICQFCKIGELISVEDEGILICRQCSRTSRYLTDSEKPSYKVPPNEICFYAYKRINHFKEIIAQVQGKETTHIPKQLIAKVKKQIVKERLCKHELTYLTVKNILKKLGFNKYYEHIPFIKNELGITPPSFPSHVEEMLFNLFIVIQPAYAKACPDDRTNFLNYAFTGYKLCEISNEPQFMKYFQLLKDEVKIAEQDVIWENMCNILGWSFIPTVPPIH